MRIALAALLISLLPFAAPAEETLHPFTFSQNADTWSVWGDGEWRHVPTLGHTEPGCLMLRCGQRQQLTASRKFDLPPGRYRVSLWLRGFGIQPGAYDYSVWLFYAVQEGDKAMRDVVRNIKGTFDWSKVTYTVDVPQDSKKTMLWIRLKSPGTLWLDDISVEPWSGDPIAYQFEAATNAFPKPNPIGEGIRCDSCYRWMPPERTVCPLCGAALSASQTDATAQHAEQPAEKLLLGFEEDAEAVEKNRTLIRATSTQSTQGARSGVIKLGAYNHFIFKEPDLRDWSGYDYIAMDVFNPLPTLERFVIAVNDKEKSSYWDQLNNYTTLAPGWNSLRFSINRYVGERGSVKIKRYLDRSNIQRFWYAVGPEDKRGIQAEFLIDNVRLTKAPPSPAPPARAQLFDFVAEDFRAQRGFLPILERHLYDPDVGFGFVTPGIWRSHDSVYADTLNRDGIFVGKGSFAVDVPNGRYVVFLCAQALGYWSEDFWTRRRIEIEGRTVLNEVRTSAMERVASNLRFEDVEPTPVDNAYDLYLKNLFQPIIAEVDVNDGQLTIAYDGDNSGICLNWLIVAPAEERPAVTAFLDALQVNLKDEFRDESRRITPTASVEATPDAASNTLYTALVGASRQVRWDDIPATEGAAISLEGGNGERPMQALAVRNLAADSQRLQLSLSPLTCPELGVTLNPEPDALRYGVNQYQCHSFNHETYELAPRYLKPWPGEGMDLPAGRTRLLWYQLTITSNTPPGRYTGALSITLGETTQEYPVTLTVHPYSLPPLDVSVGFFGLDPINLLYFNKPDVPSVARRYRHKAVDMLAERGFTSWSSLPDSALVCASNGECEVESPEIDDLMSYARAKGFRQKILTYGSGLGEILRLDERGTVAGLPEEEYRQKSATALEKKMADWLPVSITFSDEAAGYSSMVDRDLKRANVLKTYYPFLGRSGAAAPAELGSAAHELNKTFSEILLSTQTAEYMEALKDVPGQEWGMYNQTYGLFMFDRPVFGQGLYVLKHAGLRLLFNWALTLANNFPYYDLDGRENDAMMLYPRADGSVLAGLKFEWAALGVEDCRLFMLLEQLLEKAGDQGESARAWLKENALDIQPFGPDYQAMSFTARLTSEGTDVKCERIRNELRRHILNLLAAEKE